jgi:hypothetical protein
MLERISTFLAANPRFENEKLGVTSANALSLHQRLNAARSATSEMKSDTRNISRARTAARAQLKRRLSDLAGELKILLPADDSRWLLFGLTPPAERLAARKATREAQSGRSTGKATVPATGGAEKDRPAAAPVPAAGGENGGVTKQTPLSA